MNRLPPFAEAAESRRHGAWIAWTVPFWIVSAALFVLSLKL